jgi:hypothetical protein
MYFCHFLTPRISWKTDEKTLAFFLISFNTKSPHLRFLHVIIITGSVEAEAHK